MNLGRDEAIRRLLGHDHGVLSTVHPDRGVDAVPAVYAIDAAGQHVAVPIDRVKAKRSPRLQRQHNLEADPRATLLIDHWDPHDWSQLWWVRANLRYLGDHPSTIGDHLSDHLSDLLTQRYRQYADRPFSSVLVFAIDGVAGWAAE